MFLKLTFTGTNKTQAHRFFKLTFTGTFYSPKC
jgi:hypothetical protein